LASFAIRGRELVVYLWPEGQEQQSLLSKLGKHKIGKSCLYFKQLADLDSRCSKSLSSVQSRKRSGTIRRMRCRQARLRCNDAERYLIGRISAATPSRDRLLYGVDAPRHEVGRDLRAGFRDHDHVLEPDVDLLLRDAKLGLYREHHAGAHYAGAASEVVGRHADGVPQVGATSSVCSDGVRIHHAAIALHILLRRVFVDLFGELGRRQDLIIFGSAAFTMSCAVMFGLIEYRTAS
jgi:hypothetical protein